MRVVFVNRYFHPDISATSQILSDLAFHLSASFEVAVITSRQHYEDPAANLAAQEHLNGVTVHRVWSTRFGRGALIGRALDYLTFYLTATLRLARVGKSDIIVAMTDPPLVSIPASWVARLRGAHLVNWLQDIFPETASALGIRWLAGPLGRFASRLRDRSLVAATHNVVLSDAMAAIVAARGVRQERLSVIHNWSPRGEVRPLASGENPLRQAWGLGDRFVVGYSGNLGRAHELEAIIDAATRLRDRGDVAFLFIGAGKQKESLEIAVRERGLSNVIFQPYQALDALPFSLTVADCHVVSLKVELEGLVVPSKLYSSLASGRPVLFIGAATGDFGRMVQAEGVGICSDPSDPDALVRAIVRLRDDQALRTRMGLAARGLFERRFERSIAFAEWERLLLRA